MEIPTFIIHSGKWKPPVCHSPHPMPTTPPNTHTRERERRERERERERESSLESIKQLNTLLKGKGSTRVLVGEGRSEGGEAKKVDGKEGLKENWPPGEGKGEKWKEIIHYQGLH